MLFSYNWLKNYVPDLPKPEKLAELLTMHSFEVESITKKENDFILDIDVLPNRAHDCFSHWGIAREISVITNKKMKPLRRKKLKKVKSKIKPINLKIRTPSIVPRYSTLVIEGVKIQKSPDWLKKSLESVNIRSINNIVDLTNFVMLETGQPLHAFDYDKIMGKKMVVRMAKSGEKIETLDDKIHNLDDGIIVIEDGERLIDLAGIMGGKLSEVDSKTKNIILQAANFDRKSIYLAVKKLNQKTDASNIYSQGIDPNLSMSALERAYFLLTKLGGGKICQIIDIYPRKVLPKRIKLDLNYTESLLGIKISQKEIINILTKLEFKVKSLKSKVLEVETPTFRLDISIPEDLIEEIGRVRGYGKIPPQFPTVSLIPPEKNLDIFWQEMAKDILKNIGFTEVYNYSFISEESARISGDKNLIEIENPVSVEYKYLRPGLIPSLLKNIEKNFTLPNFSRKNLGGQGNFKEIKIFELGKIFGKVNKKIKEKRMLTAVAIGEEFFVLKGVVDVLLNKLGISNVWYDNYQPTPEESKLSLWHPKKCAEIKVNHKEIGFLGEISSKITENLKIKGKVIAFDIDFEKLSKLSSGEYEYRPVSRYPAAIRDLALLVPFEVRIEEVLNKIETAGGSLIRDIDLFDIYEGEELPEGKKNLAFHIIYQAEDRTLTSKEIDEIQQKIIKALEEGPEWEVRR